MNFKQFYKKQLLETSNHQYPLIHDLDDARLFYYVSLNTEGYLGDGIKRSTPQSGTYNDICLLFDDKETDLFDTISDNLTFVQAKQILLEHFWAFHNENMKLSVDTVVRRFNNFINPLENVPGNWRVVTINPEYDYNPGKKMYTFLVILEVDKASLRKQQINKDINDVDTTGLEDLL